MFVILISKKHKLLKKYTSYKKLMEVLIEVKMN